MISSVTIEVGGERHTLKMGAGAMMRLEDAFGMNIEGVVQYMEKEVMIGTIVRVLAECMNDGGGASVSEASSMVDRLGLEGAGHLLGNVSQAAFGKGDAEKN